MFLKIVRRLNDQEIAFSNFNNVKDQYQNLGAKQHFNACNPYSVSVYIRAEISMWESSK